MWRDTGIWRTVGAGGWLRPRPEEQGRPAVLTDSALQGPRKHWMGACLYTFVLLCPKQNVCCKANAGQGSGTGIGDWGQGGGKGRSGRGQAGQCPQQTPRPSGLYSSPGRSRLASPGHSPGDVCDHCRPPGLPGSGVDLHICGPQVCPLADPERGPRNTAVLQTAGVSPLGGCSCPGDASAAFSSPTLHSRPWGPHSALGKARQPVKQIR